jgi:hypothetical protein
MLSRPCSTTCCPLPFSLASFPFIICLYVAPSLLPFTSVLVVVFGISAALRGYCFSILNNRMTLRLRSELFRTLVQSEAAFFDVSGEGGREGVMGEMGRSSSARWCSRRPPSST